MLSTWPVRTTGVPPAVRPAPRRRFRFARTGMLLAVIGVMRMARMARARWRITLGFCGILLEILGHWVLGGQARGAADLLGLVIVTVAVLKSEEPAESRRRVVSQTAYRWQG